MNQCLVYISILFFMGCVQLENNEPNNTLSNNDITAHIENVIFSGPTSSELMNEYSKFTKYERNYILNMLSVIYWEYSYTNTEYNNSIRSRIINYLTMPLGYTAKYESKRIALYSKWKLDRDFALSFYNLDPSFLDFPFFEKYIDIHGYDNLPFFCYPNPLQVYNLRNTYERLNLKDEKIEFGDYKNIFYDINKQIYNDLSVTWNTAHQKMALLEHLDNGYEGLPLVPEPFNFNDVKPQELSLIKQILKKGSVKK